MSLSEGTALGRASQACLAPRPSTPSPSMPLFLPTPEAHSRHAEIQGSAVELSPSPECREPREQEVWRLGVMGYGVTSRGHLVWESLIEMLLLLLGRAPCPVVGLWLRDLPVHPQHWLVAPRCSLDSTFLSPGQSLRPVPGHLGFRHGNLSVPASANPMPSGHSAQEQCSRGKSRLDHTVPRAPLVWLRTEGKARVFQKQGHGRESPWVGWATSGPSFPGRPWPGGAHTVKSQP